MTPEPWPLRVVARLEQCREMAAERMRDGHHCAGIGLCLLAIAGSALLWLWCGLMIRLGRG